MDDTPRMTLPHRVTSTPEHPPNVRVDIGTPAVDAGFSALWQPQQHAPALVHTSQPPPNAQQLQYRPLMPSDLHMLRLAHAAVFPIDYDMAFYNAAVHSTSGIFSWVAMHASQGRPDALVGFVTARVVRLAEVDSLERMLMGLEGVLLDGQYAAYVLTLGVAHPWRGVGVATRLIDLLLRSAAQRGCVAAYLHVLSENGDAQRLYTRHGFEQRGLLKDFYSIESARKPEPTRNTYNAYLYCRHLDTTRPTTATSSILFAAIAPLHTLLLSLTSSCMPAWQTTDAPHYRFGQHTVDASRVVPLGPAAAVLEARYRPSDDGNSGCFPGVGSMFPGMSMCLPWGGPSTRSGMGALLEHGTVNMGTPWLQRLFVRHGMGEEGGGGGGSGGGGSAKRVLVSKSHNV